MSDILLALIGASKDIWRECDKKLHDSSKYWEGISIVIFVRSDVFAMTLERARDPDKLQYESLNWTDVDSLINLVNKRIIVNSGRSDDDLNWEALLEPGFSFLEMKTFLKNNILARPRDYICFFQRVVYFTHQRKTQYISKRDFNSAFEEYSQWVLLSLSSESQPYIPNMLDLLLEFENKYAVVTMPEIAEIFKEAGINERDIKRTLNFLIDINFLGYGIDENNYRFPSSPSEDTIMKRRFLRHIKNNYDKAKFKIHNAFHPILNITSKKQ